MVCGQGTTHVCCVSVRGQSGDGMPAPPAGGALTGDGVQPPLLYTREECGALALGAARLTRRLLPRLSGCAVAGGLPTAS